MSFQLKLYLLKVYLGYTKQFKNLQFSDVSENTHCYLQVIKITGPDASFHFMP